MRLRVLEYERGTVRIRAGQEPKSRKISVPDGQKPGSRL